MHSLKINYFSRVIFLLWLLVSLTSFGQTEIKLRNYASVDPRLLNIIKSNTKSLITEINYANHDKRSINFDKVNGITKSGKLRLNELWSIGKFKFTFSDYYFDLIKKGNGTSSILTNLSIALSGRDNQEKTLSLEFDSKGNLIYIYIYESISREDSYIKCGKYLSQERFETIYDLLELLIRAYHKKDIYTLENVYSDDALILVGKKVEAYVKVDNGSEHKMVLQTRNEVKKYTKEQYLNNLKSVFKRREYINITFDKIAIECHNEIEYLVGVTLVQKWESDGYSDVGNLFIAFNFIDPQSPKIVVRSWKPLDMQIEGVDQIDYR